MSGRGETPGEDEPAAEEDHETTDVDLVPGMTLYTADGRVVGKIRGIEEGGVFVSTREGTESLSVEHARSGHAFGEGYLMWRCMTCGEMGEIDEGIPETCPGCDAPKEDLMYWLED
jgi:hypothetical protein